MNTFNLQLDDLSPATRYPKKYLDLLIEQFPNIKINLFIIPFFKSIKITDTPEWLSFIKTLPKKNYEIALHGYTHFSLPWYLYKNKNDYAEFQNVTYEEAISKIELMEKLMDESGIEYKKIFKAPCWYLSKEGRKALVDKGYKIMSIVGQAEATDLTSGLENPYILSTHVGNHDGNTSYLNYKLYEEIVRLLKNGFEYKFLSEL